jgi:predicted nucleic acid-binding protein
MYLIDANIILAILLKEKKDAACKDFLSANPGQLCLSDFSLHSIGVALLRLGKADVFRKFVEDALPLVSLVTLPVELYRDIPSIKDGLGLDFDDSYQFLIAKHHGLVIVTLDRDFVKAKGAKVKFL